VRLSGLYSKKQDSNGNRRLGEAKYANKQIISITYNHLNLPFIITFTGDKTIKFTYDATGKKLSKTALNGSTLVESRKYVNGFEYTGGVAALSHIATAEGRFLPSTNKYEFSLKDHLGNTRITLTDTDGNGVLAAAEVTQSNMYYAFGLEFAAGGGTNKYKYNSKEQMSDFGLGLYDYGARMYDAATGRWNGVDALAAKFAAWSAYNYVLGNPVRFIDPDGRSADVFDPVSQQRVDQQKKTTNSMITQIDADIVAGVGVKADLEKDKKFLQINLRNITVLENSTQKYRIDEFNGAGISETTYDKNSDEIVFSIYNKGNNNNQAAHEFTHGYQFEIGDMAYEINSGKASLLYDITDEVSAYKTAFIYPGGPNALTPFSNITAANIMALDATFGTSYSTSYQSTVGVNTVVNSMYIQSYFPQDAATGGAIANLFIGKTVGYLIHVLNIAQPQPKYKMK
jgi:RHS repeat-associated protein